MCTDIRPFWSRSSPAVQGNIQLVRAAQNGWQVDKETSTEVHATTDGGCEASFQCRRRHRRKRLAMGLYPFSYSWNLGSEISDYTPSTYTALRFGIALMRCSIMFGPTYCSHMLLHALCVGGSRHGCCGYEWDCRAEKEECNRQCPWTTRVENILKTSEMTTISSLLWMKEMA
jgi:hypothetical protein